MDEMPLLLSCYEAETDLRQKGGSMVSSTCALLINFLCVSIGNVQHAAIQLYLLEFSAKYYMTMTFISKILFI